MSGELRGESPNYSVPRGRSVALAVVALLLVVLLGASRLFDPFRGDQALFFLGAEKLQHGALLYRDFWDLKQPGIYEFYLVAGRTFGFRPIAPHLLELGTWLILSVVQMAALRPSLRCAAVVVVAPLATAGAYYLGASVFDFGQPESLAGAPLFVSLWLVISGFRFPRVAAALFFAAGLLTGMAGMGKLLFGVVAVSIVVAAVSAMTQTARRSFVRSYLCYVCGACLPLAGYLVVAAIHHDLSDVLDTWFVAPREILASVPHAPLSRLIGDVRQYAAVFAMPIVLAAIAVVAKMTPEARVWRRAMLAWLVAASAVIVVQRFSWWEYHFMLFVVPIGVLATLGADVLAVRLRAIRIRQRVIAVALMTLIAAGLTARLVHRAEHRVTALVADGAVSSHAGREVYRRGESQEYADASVISGVVFKHGARSDTIFVAGDPLVYIVSGSSSQVPINGWALELLLPRQWQRLQVQLAAARPSKIFVSSGYAMLLSQRAPEITSWLYRRYQAQERSEFGVWYVVRHPRLADRAPSH